MHWKEDKMLMFLVTTIVMFCAVDACPRSNHQVADTPTAVPSPDTLRKLHNCYTLNSTTTFAHFETIMNWYRSTAEVHKDFVTLLDIGESVEKRKLMVMRVSPRPTNDRPVIFIEATQHSREWLAPVTLNNFINKMVKGYSERHEPWVSLMDKYIFYFESVANPDGYVYSFKDASTRYWRKNRRKNKICYGVDLNRNWNIGFGGPGGSRNECSIVYQGPSAFSEPETRAMKDFMLNTIGVGNLTLFISVHSYSQIWIIPYSYKIKKPENYDEMYRVVKIASEAIINQTCGNQDCYYEPLNGVDAFGQTTGGSDDWSLKIMRANYSYTLELPPSSLNVGTVAGFSPSKDVILPTAKEFEIGLLSMLKTMNTR